MKRAGSLKRKKPLDRVAKRWRPTLMRMNPDTMIDKATTLDDIKGALVISALQARERRAMRRSRLKPVGARAGRENAELVAFRVATIERCGDYCERCGCRVGLSKIESHHLVNRARCSGWPSKHDPAINSAGVCFACHRSLDLDPRDIGGPLEGAARRAFQAFEKWRAEQ